MYFNMCASIRESSHSSMYFGDSGASMKNETLKFGINFVEKVNVLFSDEPFSVAWVCFEFYLENVFFVWFGLVDHMISNRYAELCRDG